MTHTITQLIDHMALMKCPEHGYECPLFAEAIRALRLVAVPTDPIPAPHNGVETSVAAARRPSNVLRFGTQRHRVMNVLRYAGPEVDGRIAIKPGADGLTAAAIADHLSMSRNQVATRLGECHDAGWVEYVTDSDGKIVTAPTGPDDNGDRGRVHRLTPLGRAALARIKQR